MLSQGDPVEVEIFFPRCTKKSERTHFPSVQMVVEITLSLSLQLRKGIKTSTSTVRNSGPHRHRRSCRISFSAFRLLFPFASIGSPSDSESMFLVNRSQVGTEGLG